MRKEAIAQSLSGQGQVNQVDNQYNCSIVIWPTNNVNSSQRLSILKVLAGVLSSLELNIGENGLRVALGM